MQNAQNLLIMMNSIFPLSDAITYKIWMNFEDPIERLELTVETIPIFQYLIRLYYGWS